MTTNKKQSKLNVLIDKQKLERFKKITKKENSDVSKTVRILIDKYLSEKASEYELI